MIGKHFSWEAWVAIKSTVAITVVIGVAVLGAIGCGSDDQGGNTVTTSTPQRPADDAKNNKTSDAKKMKSSAVVKKVTPANAAEMSKKTQAQIMTIDTRYGKILTDGSGRALYLFTREKSDKSDCYDDCAKAWPPFHTKGEPQAKSPTSQDLIGTTKRRDGSTQVTFNGHPLYYYVDEDEAGEVLCQGVNEFGGIWYVVSPSGEAITKS